MHRCDADGPTASRPEPRHAPIFVNARARPSGSRVSNTALSVSQILALSRDGLPDEQAQGGRAQKHKERRHCDKHLPPQDPAGQVPDFRVEEEGNHSHGEQPQKAEETYEEEDPQPGVSLAEKAVGARNDPDRQAESRNQRRHGRVESTVTGGLNTKPIVSLRPMAQAAMMTRAEIA